MKRILLFTSILLFTLSFSTVRAQTIDTVLITQPILCYGDFAAIDVQITQSSPNPTPLNYILQYAGTCVFYFQVGQSPLAPNTTTGISQPFINLISGCYRMVLKDASGSILDSYDFYVGQPFALANNDVSVSEIQCFGDCSAAQQIQISGGTRPYTLTLNSSVTSGNPTTLGFISGDTTYSNLCQDSYTVDISDSNNCTSSLQFTINEPALLVPSGTSLKYNGQDISCFGASDGEITAIATGGTLPYEYSIDAGATWQLGAVFPGLGPGTYTIDYRDANGCDTSETFTLSDPPDLSGALTIINQVSCFNVADGSIQYIVNNINTGTPGYQYSIDNGTSFQFSSTFNGLSGGLTYDVIVKDVNNCQDTASIFLSQPTEIIFTASSPTFNGGFQVSCFGALDGQIIIGTPSGGAPGYEYSIDNGTTWSFVMAYSGLAEASYDVLVRDVNSCQSDTNMVLDAPGDFVLSSSITNPISCYGICDGEIAVTQINGVGLITYSMNTFPAQFNPSWDFLCADTYTIQATDVNGCIATPTTILLTEPLAWIYTVDSLNASCNLANGEASVNVIQGGSGSLAYLWNDPAPSQITPTANGLSTGMYQVTVTDPNGCFFVEDVFVDETSITLAFDSAAPCNSGNDGYAEVIANGVPGYTYQWSDNNGIMTGEINATLSGLSPGFYYVTVTDATNCSVTDSVEIPNSALVELTLDSLNSILSVDCNGFQSSGITVNATGGIPNTYFYYIPNFFPIPQTSSTFSGLYAGTYTVFVEDFNLCTDSVVVTITEPDPIVLAISKKDISCDALTDGSAWIDTIYGGNPGYINLWSNGSALDSIFSLTAGNYTLQVTDTNNCLSNVASVNIIEPPILVSSVTVASEATCAGSQTLATGEMSVVASGGVASYDYLWNTGSTSPLINFLMPGIYTVSITDQNNCTVTDSAEILSGENPIVAVSLQHVSCFGLTDGFMTTAAIDGTPPYLFSDDGGVTFTGSSSFGPTGAANYFITVVDALGCTDTASVDVNEPAQLQVSLSIIQNVSCYDSSDASIIANVSGGTPGFTYLWDDVLGQTTQTATNLSFNTYSVSVLDTNNCPANSNSIQVNQADSLYILSLTQTSTLCNGDSTGSANVVAAGGTGTYSYLWSDGQINQTATNLYSDSYSVQISDINGCHRDSIILVSEPSLLSTSYNKDSVNCMGGLDGFVTVIVSGGVGPYEYLWENGDTLDLSDSLSAGWYSVIIKDFNLCELVDSVEILEPSFPFMIDSLLLSQISCHNANNASISVLATGGTPPYAYSIDNGLTQQPNIGFIGLGPNSYDIYVEDSEGCIDTSSVTFVNPDTLYISSVVYNNISCYGYSDGSITAINVVGNTAPYQYSVDGGFYYLNTSYFTGLNPGSHTVEVLDSSNCGALTYIDIIEPQELDVSITTSASNWAPYEIQCYGDSSGTADILVSGGLSPYTYTVTYIGSAGTIDTVISTTNSSIINLSANIYTFIVTDANGCTYTEVISYNEPSLIEHNFISTHVTCSGWNNGMLTDVITGGVGSATTYSYSWNTGDSTYSISSIPVGTYIMTVVDEIGCISKDTTTINDNNALNIAVTNHNDISCYDYCDGSIETTTIGGMPNINSSGVAVYTYLWNDILLQNQATAIGLCVDNTLNSSTYTCIVTDGQGCTDTVSHTLTQELPVDVSISILTEISCNSGNNGRLRAIVSGGSPNYTYLWNDGSNNSSNNNLSAGSYVVSVVDANGCMDTTEIYLPEPLPLSIVISNDNDINCYGDDDGKITATADGGTPLAGIPPQYKYTWSTGLIETVSNSTITDLQPGIYTVTATDANGCTITSPSVNINQPGNPLIISVDSTDESCKMNDGTAFAEVNGGTEPYTYVWDNGGSNSIIDNLLPNQSYNVTVTDKNGCVISGGTFVNGIKNIFLPGNLESVDTTICLGNSVILPIQIKGENSLTPLTYVWTYNNDTIYSASSDEYNQITVSPTDTINQYDLHINYSDPTCSSNTVTAIVRVLNSIDPLISSAPLPMMMFDVYGNPSHLEAQINAGESINLFSNNMNCESYNWSWRADNDTVITIIDSTREITDESPNETRWYYLQVGSEGCLGFDNIRVVVGIATYDAISPNGDGWNDTWDIPGIEYYPDASIQIFNRWGAIVYQSSGSSYIAWDGTRSGNELPVGTYYYTIDFNNGNDPQSGPITIIR